MKSGFSSFINLLGGISGMISIGTLVFFGGGLVQQVKGLDARVSIIETAGSPSAREHAKEDAAQYADHERRIERLENAVLVLSEINSKLDKLLSK